MMTRKQLYLMLLANGLVFIRNHQSQNKSGRWWPIRFGRRKSIDRACYEVAQFLHNLPGFVAEPGFTKSDLWFLNQPARTFFQKIVPKNAWIDQGFSSPVRQLFQLVPEEMRGELKWAGPELRMTPKWQAEMNEQLFWAVTENTNIETLHYALTQGADITARDGDGKTALTRAIELGKEHHIQVLKEAGAQE